jgi:hypothetical protein
MSSGSAEINFRAIVILFNYQVSVLHVIVRISNYEIINLRYIMYGYHFIT